MNAVATWMGGSAERPALFFDTAEDFRAWLADNHDTATELWMGLFKKHAGDRGLTWAEAVPEALCYGWIDSVTQRVDEDTVRQRWSPRKPRSNWSRVNIALVERLTAEGRMQPAGLAAFARRPGEGEGAPEHDGEPVLAPGYEARLRADPAAAQFFFERATPSYRRTCITWIMSGKAEATRERRLTALIDDSAAGLLIRPLRLGEPPKWARG